MRWHPQSPGPAWEIPVTGKATAIGSISIGLWGALALFTTQTGGQIPPFQLMALTFLIAWGLMQLNWWRQGKSGLSFMRQPPKAWLLGVGGLFLYHFCYFAAMERAPAADVSLIAYLWPLLIVIFSSFLPGGKLLPRHLGGAVIALIGCYFLIVGGGDSSAGYQSAYASGYLLASLCALIWSGYSVLNRRYADVPTDAVGWFCLAVSGFAWIAHLSLETSVWPSDLGVWIGVIGLGLGTGGHRLLYLGLWRQTRKPTPARSTVLPHSDDFRHLIGRFRLYPTHRIPRAGLWIDRDSQLICGQRLATTCCLNSTTPGLCFRPVASTVTCYGGAGTSENRWCSFV